MPIDPSIALQARLPQIENPLEVQAKVQQFRGMQQQNRLADLMFAEKQRASDLAGGRRNALTSAWNPETGQLDDAAYTKGLAGIGDYEGLQSHRTAQLAQQKAAREAEKAELAGVSQKLELVGQYLGPTLENPALYPQALAALRQQIPGGGKDLPDQFDPAAVQAALSRAMSVKDQVAQIWKQKEFDLDEKKFSETKRHNEVAERTAQGNLGIAQANLGVSRERLAFDKSPQKAAAKPLSATMQKELFEADDIAQSSKNVIGMLNGALKLNDTAYSGFGATERAKIRGQLPGDTSSANATIDLDNIMTGQALESLKAVFGGMPTEGERKILLDMQASADKTPAQRKSIIERSIAAAERRLKFNEAKAKSLRDGSYNTAGPQQTESDGPDIDALLKKYGG